MMTRDEILREKMQDWGCNDDRNTGYEYVVYCERDGNDGFMDEIDESFNDLDQALDFRDEMIANGWEVRQIRRYDSNTYDTIGTVIKI